MKKQITTNLSEIIKQPPRALTDGELFNKQEEKSSDYSSEDIDNPIPPADQIEIPSKIDIYELKGTIGKGAFSVVKLAYNPKTQSYYACKIIQKRRMEKGNLLKRFECEIRVHQQLHHPSIVQIYDLFTDDNFFYIIMEFCPHGELFQYIVDRGLLPESIAAKFIHQLLTSVSYIHKLNITHRDLKPENLLLDEYGCIKLSDFGLSRFLDPQGLAYTPCGSPCYASPECLSGHPFDGKKSDVWSCGVIMYAMITGQLPWTKRNQNQLFNQIRNGEYQIPPFVSPLCADFISKLMTVDYRDRPSADEALLHPFISSIKTIAQSTHHLIPIVSMKRVDQFFGREDSFTGVQIAKDPSLPSQSFEATSKMIRKRNVKRRVPRGSNPKILSTIPRKSFTFHKKPIRRSTQISNLSEI